MESEKKTGLVCFSKTCACTCEFSLNERFKIVSDSSAVLRVRIHLHQLTIAFQVNIHCLLFVQIQLRNCQSIRKIYKLLE